MSAPCYYRFDVGRFHCLSLSDGSYEYDPVKIFPGISEEYTRELVKGYPQHNGMIISPYSFLFVDTGLNKILCDMGAGSLGPDTGKFIDSLKMGGVMPEEIDNVIITHAHPDHIGGTLNEKGFPNFPNACYYIWKEEWDFWFSDDSFSSVEDHYSTILKPEVFMKTARGQLGPVRDRIIFMTKESEILPGVHIHRTPGHTPGHIAVSFVSEENELYFVGDAIVFSFLIENPDVIPVFDLIPGEADKTKRDLCNILSAKRALVHAQHFSPFPSLGHIIRNGAAFKWEPVDGQ